MAEKLFNESHWLEDSEKLKLHQNSSKNLGDGRNSVDNEKEDSHVKSNIASGNYKSHLTLNKNENGDNQEIAIGLEEENESFYPKDYSLATYYLASNMTIQDNDKQALLEAENIIIRLR